MSFLKNRFIIEVWYMSNLKIRILEYLGYGEDGHTWIKLEDRFCLLGVSLKILEGL